MSTETEPLLAPSISDLDTASISPPILTTSNLSFAILPIAFTAAIGTAAAAAPTIYAYASLFCADPTHCTAEESHAFARTVAISSTIASVCGILAVGPVEQLFRRRRKWGIVTWLFSRGMGIAMLVVAVLIHRSPVAVAIAILGRVFEGFATDDLLHLNLNAFYVESASLSQAPRLLGSSLALYMMGMASGPVIAGLLNGFMAGFFMALAAFSISIIYLLTFLPRGSTSDHIGITRESIEATDEEDSTILKVSPRRDQRWVGLIAIFQPFLQPLLFLQNNFAVPNGLAILLLNAGQGYFFQALLVHMSTSFGFTSKQNGLIISTVAASSGFYLFLVLYLAPRIWKYFGSADSNPRSANVDYALAMLSMLSFATTSFLLAWATERWQVYSLVAFTGVGLSAPPFIKSQLNTLTSEHDRSRAVAALTIMESIGSVLSPIILGSLQSSSDVYEGAIFFATSGIIFLATLALSLKNFEYFRPR